MAPPASNARKSFRGRGRARRLLSALIEKNIIRLGETVYYRGTKRSGRVRVLAQSRISSAGIVCSCCAQILSLSGFEAHAGSKNRWPSKHIFLEDGRSLSDCLVQWENAAAAAPPPPAPASAPVPAPAPVPALAPVPAIVPAPAAAPAPAPVPNPAAAAPAPVPAPAPLPEPAMLVAITVCNDYCRENRDEQVATFADAFLRQSIIKFTFDTVVGLLN